MVDIPIYALRATTKPRRNSRAAAPLETARRYICLKIRCRDDTPFLPLHRHRSSQCIATPFRPAVAAVALGHEKSPTSWRPHENAAQVQLHKKQCCCYLREGSGKRQERGVVGQIVQIRARSFREPPLVRVFVYRVGDFHVCDE